MSWHCVGVSFSVRLGCNTLLSTIQSTKAEAAPRIVALQSSNTLMNVLE